MRLSLVLSTILLGVTSVLGGYPSLRSDGYYYDGHNPQPYTRVSHYNAGSYGYCGYYTYSYTPYYAPAQAYIGPVAPAYTPDWKVENIKYKAQLADYEAYLQAVGRVAYPIPQAVTYQQNFAAQASTAYGSSFNQQLVLSGDVDVNAAIQAYARVVQQTVTSGSTAEQGLGAITERALSDKLKTLEAIAALREREIRAATAVSVLRALEEKKIVINNSGGGFIFGPNPNQPNVNPPPVPAEAPRQIPQIPNDENLERLGFLFQRDCSMCHSSVKKEGGLDLQEWRSFDRAKKDKVYDRVTTKDLEKAMPRTKDGSVGKRWTLEEAELLKKS